MPLQYLAFCGFSALTPFHSYGLTSPAEIACMYEVIYLYVYVVILIGICICCFQLFKTLDVYIVVIYRERRFNRKQEEIKKPFENYENIFP
jgi:hypothetical protein